MTVAAILLAAGASRRMGSPKPLLPWGGGTLLGWELDQLARSCVDQIVVVTGAYADEVRRALASDGRYCVFNPRWGQGRATSLVAGARALMRGRADGTAGSDGAALEAILVQSVDQPTRADIIDRLVEALHRSDADTVQPSFSGESGHPVVLRGTLLDDLARASEATEGLRAIVEAHRRELVPMDDEPIVRLNLNTPETLDEGRRLLGVTGAD